VAYLEGATLLGKKALCPECLNYEAQYCDFFKYTVKRPAFTCIYFLRRKQDD